MRTSVTIFFLVLMVFIQTPAGQLLKLPILIEHFMKHQTEDGVSLTGFLQDHYSPGHNDADIPEDEQLPFKNITFYSIGYALIPTVIKTIASNKLPADKKLIFSEACTPQQHIGSIFHPPRV